MVEEKDKMPTNILSSIMNAAGDAAGRAQSASASVAGNRGGQKEKDPNQAAILAQMKKLADEGNHTALEALQPQAKQVGLEPALAAMLIQAKTPTPEQKMQNDINLMGLNLMLQGFMGQLGMNQQGAPQAQPVSISPNIPTAPSQPPTTAPSPTSSTPSLSPTPIGPSWEVTGLTGEGKPIFKDTRLDGEKYLDRQVKRGKMTLDEREGILDTMNKIEIAGLTNDIKTSSFQTDPQTGKLYANILFKNGTARRIEASGPSISTRSASMASLASDQITALNTAVSEGRLDPNRINSRTAPILADMELENPGAIDYSKVSENILQGRTEARGRGGTRAMNLTVANNVYQKTIPEVIDLRRKLRREDFPNLSKLKDFNAVDQWARTRTSDPVLSKFKGKVLILSEQLQRIFTSQGGEWAFKAAQQLLDGSLDAPAFESLAMGHATDLNRAASEARSFGEESLAEVPGIPPTGSTPAQSAPKEALDYLKGHPELKDQFKLKYGYLPEGY